MVTETFDVFEAKYVFHLPTVISVQKLSFLIFEFPELIMDVWILESNQPVNVLVKEIVWYVVKALIGNVVKYQLQLLIIEPRYDYQLNCDYIHNIAFKDNWCKWHSYI